jgi:hypothetical protein
MREIHPHKSIFNKEYYIYTLQFYLATDLLSLMPKKIILSNSQIRNYIIRKEIIFLKNKMLTII